MVILEPATGWTVPTILLALFVSSALGAGCYVLVARIRRSSGMAELWGPLDAGNWRSTPAIESRTATEADIRAGVAVFYMPSGSTPHPIQLPICAIHRDAETGKATPIVVIQAEAAGDKVFIGARPLEGGNMVAFLSEMELVVEPDERFFNKQ